jgi:hypothetical protein
MLKSVTVVLVAVSLGGSPENLYAWDGLGLEPSAPAPIHRKIATKKHDPASSMASARDDDESALAAVPKYSKEWVNLYAAKQKRDDAKLKRGMIICRGC